LRRNRRLIREARAVRILEIEKELSKLRAERDADVEEVG
jgi:hypothetical protein